MTAAAGHLEAEADGVLEKLQGAVSAEFRVDTLVFAADDPIFGSSLCHVGGCERAGRAGFGLCAGHRQRWQHAGRPDLEAFARSTDPRWRRQRPNMKCRVPGCGYGCARSGMCSAHARQWIRGGKTDLDSWIASAPMTRQPEPGALCALEHCDLWPHATSPFCLAHNGTWRANGKPPIEEFRLKFIASTVLADQTVTLDGLGPRMKMEIQYALQCRRNDRGTKAPPSVVMQVVRFLRDTGDISLLDQTDEGWRMNIGRPAPKDSNPRAFVLYARARVEGLSRGGGWEHEYEQDVWHLRRLGFHGNNTLSFAPIPSSGSENWSSDGCAGGSPPIWFLKRYVRACAP